VDEKMPPARLELTTFGLLDANVVMVYETNALPTELQKQAFSLDVQFVFRLGFYSNFHVARSSV
jgi:hypothetical protein